MPPTNIFCELENVKLVSHRCVEVLLEILLFLSHRCKAMLACDFRFAESCRVWNHRNSIASVWAPSAWSDDLALDLIHVERRVLLKPSRSYLHTMSTTIRWVRLLTTWLSGFVWRNHKSGLWLIFLVLKVYRVINIEQTTFAVEFVDCIIKLLRHLGRLFIVPCICLSNLFECLSDPLCRSFKTKISQFALLFL